LLLANTKYSRDIAKHVPIFLMTSWLHESKGNCTKYADVLLCISDMPHSSFHMICFWEMAKSCHYELMMGARQTQWVQEKSSLKIFNIFLSVFFVWLFGLQTSCWSISSIILFFDHEILLKPNCKNYKTIINISS
jgi:hypothetical protein